MYICMYLHITCKKTYKFRISRNNKSAYFVFMKKSWGFSLDVGHISKS